MKNTSISINFLMNIFLTMSSFVFPLITFPYISRILLAGGYGKVQMATSVISYFILFAQLGLPTYGIRVCATVRGDSIKLTRTVHELFFIQTITMILAYVMFFVCLNLIPKMEDERNLYLITSALILLNSIGVEWLFKAMEQYTYITVRSLIFKMISLVAMFMLVQSEDDYLIYAAISVFASGGSNIMNLIQLPKYILLKPIGGYQIRKHVKPILVLFAYVCATTIYTNLDSVMLGFMIGDVEVGYYSVAVKIKNILVSIVTALGAVVLPRVSYYYEQKEFDRFWDLASKAFRFVLMISVPLTVYFMIFAKQGIFFLSGSSYASSIMPMFVIMPTLVCIGLTSVTGIQILIPSKRENIVLYASIAGALIDLVLNIFLIPVFYSTGAALGTLAAEAVVLIIHVTVLRKELIKLKKKIEIGKILGATLVSGIVTFGFVFVQASDFAILTMSSILFFLIYLLMLHLCKDSLLLKVEGKIKEFMKGRKRS